MSRDWACFYKGELWRITSLPFLSEKQLNEMKVFRMLDGNIPRTKVYRKHFAFRMSPRMTSFDALEKNSTFPEMTICPDLRQYCKTKGFRPLFLVLKTRMTIWLVPCICFNSGISLVDRNQDCLQKTSGFGLFRP